MDVWDQMSISSAVPSPSLTKSRSLGLLTALIQNLLHSKETCPFVFQKKQKQAI